MNCSCPNCGGDTGPGAYCQYCRSQVSRASNYPIGKFYSGPPEGVFEHSMRHDSILKPGSIWNDKNPEYLSTCVTYRQLVRG